MGELFCLIISLKWSSLSHSTETALWLLFYGLALDDITMKSQWDSHVTILFILQCEVIMNSPLLWATKNVTKKACVDTQLTDIWTLFRCHHDRFFVTRWFSLLLTLGYSLQNNRHGDCIVLSLNVGYSRVTRWLYCNIIRLLVTKQWSWWLLNVVTKWQSYKNNN